ncbi:hypothetical protein [Marinobacter bohaiensis]|uniref:hypothetical protein n=1 Tax=Marinobacter bohaiensis TaxID=2201898 RepID=UPI000DAE1044|nr:hypothetical protein [Marinobacter bohaiensis]
MMESLLTALEQLPAVAALRQSTWMYPLVNTGHILGVALLVGAIVPLDIRLLGGWRRFPLMPFLHVLRRVAAAGLALAVVCGLLLFAARASEYAAAYLFQLKLGLIGLGGANVAVVQRLLARHAVADLPLEATLPVGIRLGAVLSLLAWLGALLCGRLLGYF